MNVLAISMLRTLVETDYNSTTSEPVDAVAGTTGLAAAKTLLHAWALNDAVAAELINAWPINEIATHYVAIWVELHARECPALPADRSAERAWSDVYDDDGEPLCPALGDD